MQAVILCNKKIPTLNPLCEHSTPATLAILNKTLLEHTLEALKANGFSEFTVVVKEQAGDILNLVEALRESYDIRVYTSEKPLPETLRRVWLGSDVLAVSCNRFPLPDIKNLIKTHNKLNSPLTTLVKTVEKDPFELLQKPSTDFADTGVYILSQELVASIPLETKTKSMSELYELNPKTIAVPDFSDSKEIKTPKDVFEANKYALENAGNSKEKEYEISQGFFNKSGSFLRGVTVIPPVYVGKNVHVGRGTVLDSGTILCDNSAIGESCYLKGAIFGKSCSVSDKTTIDNSLLEKGVNVMKGATLEKMSVIGAKTTIGENTIVKQNVKIKGGKNISPNITVTENVMEQPDGVVLFDDDGAITDLCGFVTPAFCAKLGAAVGTALDKTQSVAVSFSGKKSAEILADALSAGLSSTGITVWKLNEATRGELAFSLNQIDAPIGIEVAVDFKTSVKIISKGGLKIPSSLEAKIEENLNFSLSRQAPHDSFGEILSAKALTQLYLDRLEKSLPKRFKNLNISVKTSDKRIAQLSDKLFNPRNDVNGETVTFHINSSDEGVSAYSERTGYIFREKLTLIALKFHLSQGNDISLPETFPDAAETISEALTGSVMRYNLTSDDKADKLPRKIASMPENLFVNDPLSLAVKLASVMQENSLSLKTLSQDLPQFYTTQRFVAVSPEETELYVTRTVIGDEQGTRAVVKPVKNAKGIMIYAQALKAETATAFCDDIERKLKTMHNPIDN